MNASSVQQLLNRVFGALPTSLIIGVIVLVAIAILVRVVAQIRRDRLPQYVRKPLLTENELDFARQLRAVCPPELVICPQVALSALIDVAAHVAERRAARNRFAQRYADFVLCSAESYDIIGIIELDDRTHERAQRRERDLRLDAIYASIGLPVTHVQARRTGRYTPRDAEAAIGDLRRQIAARSGTAH